MPARAYEFACDRSLAEMAPLLTRAGPWTWSVRDCAWYPDYLQCRPEEGIRICVYEVNPPGGPAYRSLVEIRAGAGRGPDPVDRVFLELLDALPARAVVEIEAGEWPFD